MIYKSLQPIYLIGLSDNTMILLNFFEFNGAINQWKNIDFVVKLKNIKINIKNENKNTKMCSLNFVNILNRNNIEQFKLSPNLNKDSYLKQIYDGNAFNMLKLNGFVLIDKKLLENTEIFAIETKKSNYTWIIIILFVLFLLFVTYNFINNKI